MYPDSLNRVVNSFKKLPGIGEKTAERLAFSVLNFDLEEISEFSESLKYLKDTIKPCKICGTLTDTDICYVCSDKTRDPSSLVVVQDSKDVFLFEKIGNFKGYYHVLGGLISPIDDIGPDDLAIADLIKRIKEGNIKEVILAIKSGIEADTTALYIGRLLEKENVVVSRIASGIPIGADMDYVDALTLDSALKNRKEVLNTE